MRFRALISAGLAVATLQACAYQPVSLGTGVPEPELHFRDRVRVTTLDGKRTLMRAPKLVGDTLQGIPTSSSGNSQMRAIPVDSIEGVELQKTNTTAVVIGVAAGAALIAMLAWLGEDWGWMEGGSSSSSTAR